MERDRRKLTLVSAPARFGKTTLLVEWLKNRSAGEQFAARVSQGVFNTRSPDRPNPIGLHRVQVVPIDGHRFRVRNLEALDATPIVDVKPVLTPS